MVLQTTPELRLEILTQASRLAFWNLLAALPLPEAKWIVAGDFNNVESMEDMPWTILCFPNHIHGVPKVE